MDKITVLNPPSTDHERYLLNQVARGDQEAFKQLYNTFKDKLCSFIFVMSHSRETAEDVVQDVFLKIWLQRERLAGIENFNAYLFKMSQNHFLNLLRRIIKKKQGLSKVLEEDTSIFANPDQQLIYKNIRMEIEKIVSELPSRQKDIYVLKREVGLKHEEIAEQLQISLSTVKNHLTQALKTIQKKINHYNTLILVVTLMLSAIYFLYF